jgi:hypothetical protein
VGSGTTLWDQERRCGIRNDAEGSGEPLREREPLRSRRAAEGSGEPLRDQESR